MKMCNHCKLKKAAIEFGKDRHSKDGSNPKCKICCRAFQSARKQDKQQYDKEYREKNRERLMEHDRKRDPEKRRLFKLKKNFNLTKEEELQFIQEQKGVCAICRRPEWVKVRGTVKRLAVDHSRRTGRVRGLLCNNCNRAVGMIYESINTAENMVAYLIKHKEDLL